MKVRNRNRWSDMDDPFYYSRRYTFNNYGYNCFGNPWTPASYWNNQYNPYYNGYIIVNPKTSVTYSGPRTFNLNSYNNNAINNSNYSTPKIRGGNNNSNNNTYNSPRNSNSNNNSNAGNILREAAPKTTLLPLAAVPGHLHPAAVVAVHRHLCGDFKWPLLTSPQGEAIITAFRLLNILFIAFNS